MNSKWITRLAIPITTYLLSIPAFIGLAIIGFITGKVSLLEIGAYIFLADTFIAVLTLIVIAIIIVWNIVKENI